MTTAFNIEELRNVLNDFYNITHIRITVFDSELHELISYPEHYAAFCTLIRSTTQGQAACERCDQEACAMASKQSKVHIYRCHAGLTEAIMPLHVGNALVGYLWFGHVCAYDSLRDAWQVIEQCCVSYPVDKNALQKALEDCPQVSREYLNSAARILHATASYLVLERMATLREDSAAARLDAYVSTHFTDSFTSHQLAQELNIGRSKLYELSSQLYGCGISEQIRRLRISLAKQLLADHPEMSITAIASECGYEDYNYFITVFTRMTGISPGAYRRNL